MARYGKELTNEEGFDTGAIEKIVDAVAAAGAFSESGRVAKFMGGADAFYALMDLVVERAIQKHVVEANE